MYLEHASDHAIGPVAHHIHLPSIVRASSRHDNHSHRSGRKICLERQSSQHPASPPVSHHIQSQQALQRLHYSDVTQAQLPAQSLQ